MGTEPPKLGAYTITQEISRNAWGILYEARESKSQTLTLLRVISSEISKQENFAIRFNLLKTILPNISHKNLLQVFELGKNQNLYYLASEFPAESAVNLINLSNYDASDTLHRLSTLENIFQGIAEGLAALEKVNISYYKQGIIHDDLSLSNIYISQEKSLIGKQIPLAKISAFGESFLFFGENAQATLSQHMYPTSIQWRKQQSNPLETRGTHPYLRLSEKAYSPEARQGQKLTQSYPQYRFGSLIYEYFNKKIPQGIFPSLQEQDPRIPQTWDKIIDKCLSSPFGKGFASMQEVADLFKSQSNERNKVPSEIRKLEELEPPEGMALIILTEKVELGANDGPTIEQPRFKGRIRSFFIDVHPVTCTQVEEFQKNYKRSTHSSGDFHPATLISWHNALAYCDWRSEKENLPKGTYRLPTEYEWESAVRGSSGEQYPWGKFPDPTRVHCNYEESRGSFSIKRLAPGRFGIYDMLGNIWEWTASIFKPHPFSENKKNIYPPNLIVAKGGCWFTPKEKCRASLRAAFKPTERRGNLGFRCVRSIELEKETSNKDSQKSIKDVIK